MSKTSFHRKDRLIKTKRQDTYREQGKWPEPTLCTECGSIFMNGRWTWNTCDNNKVYESICPSCRRCADNYPAGHIRVSGPFYIEHQEEILNLIRRIGSKEKNERPLERIMSIKNRKRYTDITTTGVHVARRIGEALSRAYKGDYSFRYADSDKSILVQWQR
jgi:NMD protein affecting ribosome stability and mRNA decay